MHYKYKDGVKKANKASWRILSSAGLVCLVVGVYLLSLTFVPALPVSNNEVQAVKQTLKSQATVSQQNRLYIPKIGLSQPIVMPAGNLEDALSNGIVNLESNSGNPAQGGNYVLAGHRFDYGYTPSRTIEKSPLYHIDKLETGDYIYVDYNGERYAYEIDVKKQVAPTDTSIERPTEQPRLTLYTCKLEGPEADRIVVFADPVGKVTWTGGESALKAL